MTLFLYQRSACTRVLVQCSLRRGRLAASANILPHPPKLLGRPCRRPDSSIWSVQHVRSPWRARPLPRNCMSNSTVLIVEDNEDNLLIYTTVLRLRGGFEVLEAGD